MKPIKNPLQSNTLLSCSRLSTHTTKRNNTRKPPCSPILQRTTNANKSNKSLTPFFVEASLLLSSPLSLNSLIPISNFHFLCLNPRTSKLYSRILDLGFWFFGSESIGMRKRERENPCGVCGHYHKYEEGEVCGICGHRMPEVSEKTSLQVSAFPSEILPEFLYLGSYDNASRSELLKTQGISRILNTVPSCQNLYKNSFTYHCLQDDKSLPFDDAIQILVGIICNVDWVMPSSVGEQLSGWSFGYSKKERKGLGESKQCEKDRARVLVHCMSGKSRSPAIVIAYLMKSKGWRLAQGYQWVKERRPSVELTQAVYQKLQEYEQKIFGSTENSSPVFQSLGVPSFSLGFPKPNEPIPVPAFNSLGATSIFGHPTLDINPREFTFGAGSGVPFGENLANPNSNDIPMDGT
ncbi:unnamed protein product [Camellia sinensis]